MPDDAAEAVASRVLGEMAGLGVRVVAATASPIRGSGAKSAGRGNLEWLALVEPVDRGEYTK